MPLSERVQVMLKEREPAENGLVFHREDGTPLLPTSVNQSACGDEAADRLHPS